MIIPTSVKLLGHTIPVILEDLEKAECAGQFHPFKNIIYIDESLPRTLKESTLIHEYIEAINYYLDLDLTETKIRALEQGVYQLFTQIENDDAE